MSEEELAAQMLRYAAGEPDPSLAEHPDLKQQAETLRSTWEDLGRLPVPQPSAALRARFYQSLNTLTESNSRAPWWNRRVTLQWAAGLALFLLGIGVGYLNRPAAAPPEVAQLRTQVEGLRQTVALSLMDKRSASSRLQGVEWSSQVDQPDQELLTALLTTLNHDQNINVRLASLDALEKFTSDAGVRKALEQSITTQQSPLLQIALIDALVHIHDNGAAGQFKQLSSDSSLNAAVRQRAQWAVQKLSLE